GNTLGFLQQWTTPANSFDLHGSPAPAWDGTPMSIGSFPGVTLPQQLIFPINQPQDLGMRIESSIDRGIEAPVNYSANVTFGRELPKKLYFETSYIMRKARNLLARRDVMSPNNLVDPISGTDYYSAARILAEHVYAGGNYTNAPNVAFFNNLWAPGSIGSAIGGSWDGLTNSQVFVPLAGPSTDWTYPQFIFDAYGDQILFYQAQYGALDSFRSIVNSAYHAVTLSIRQRLSTLTWDINYPFSHSM